MEPHYGVCHNECRRAYGTLGQGDASTSTPKAGALPRQELAHRSGERRSTEHTSPMCCSFRKSSLILWAWLARRNLEHTTMVSNQ